MKVSTVKQQYKNKWVLAEVLKENKLNQAVDVKPVLASDDRDEIYEKLGKMPRNKTFATFYTGELKGIFAL